MIRLTPPSPSLFRPRFPFKYSPFRRFSSLPSLRFPASAAPTMNWSTSVLTTASSDTEPTILITFDTAKYIFNAGENSNRAFLQSRNNWKRARGFFLTQTGTQRANGIPGLLMSLAESPINKLDIVGPPGLSHFIASMRMYTYRDTMPINTIETTWDMPSSSNPDAIYQDDNITVYSFPVLPALDNLSPLMDNSGPLPEPPTDTMTIDSNANSSLKRKRESTPILPQKRRLLDLGKRKVSESLHEAISDPEFVPEQLEGVLADEWRKFMIDTMFPRPKPEEHKNNSPQKKSRKGMRDSVIQKAPVASVSAPPADSPSKDGSAPPESIENINNDYRRSRPRVPFRFHLKLPKHTLTTAGTPSSPTAPTLAYIVVGPRVRGKFDVQKAEELGIYGKNRALLTRGQTVTFQVTIDGKKVERTVKPEEIIGKSEVPGVVIILDVPSPNHISSLQSSFEGSPFFRRFRSKEPEDLSEYAVRTIYHMCGKGVVDDPRYAEFMNGFGPHAHHIVSAREYLSNPITFTSSAFNQLRLNQLDPVIFPVPHYSLKALKDIASIPNLPPNTIPMISNQVIQMRPPAPPAMEPTAEENDRFHPVILSGVPLELSEGAQKRFKDAHKNVDAFISEGKLWESKGADVGILPLGTGSALPSKYRNVSSTLIQIPNWGNILLDAGEGTWGQLIRHFGEDDTSSPNVWKVLRDLKCIFISHMHGDHHMGLSQILAKRRQLDPPPTEPLYLVSLRGVHLYLREISEIQDLGLDDPSGNGVITIMSEALHWKKHSSYQTTGMWQVGGDEPWTEINRSRRLASGLCTTLGLESLDTVDVYHRARCYGCVIKHKDGWSLVFSGDTQPTDNLVWAGRNATVLIHEATMADDQEELARKKAHSTFGQAIGIGRKMRAENILLTHFSARYPKMPPSIITSPKEAKSSGRKEPIVALAFDHAALTIGSLWKLNYYLPALEQSFRDLAEEGDDEENEALELEGAAMDVDIA
ncbi:hypothetical protein BDQ12DRAFT_734488 [Crucibulum laeve]|uniref:ribonuclease Z n=1 Tax=Crucibulum laeve TaxID=68775 RepID=A0A5C3M2V6_9AGAR|nr:hypothetical protein BDQ12DRAFT_734488 [Crucibulum laeve]